MSSDIYYTVEDGEVPPSYFEAISPSPNDCSTLSINPSSGNGLSLPSSLTTSLTSPLTTHLRNLPIRMRANQAARLTEQASRDLEIITLLAPHVEKFLSDLGSMDRIPPRAELTLVPGTIVPRGAKMSGAAERRREGEVVRVVRVEFPPTKRDSDSKSGGFPSEKGGESKDSGHSRNNNGSGFDDSDEDDFGFQRSESGFDEWGRFETEETSSSSKGNPWFFRDEDMANRLAAYLRPEPNLDRRHIQSVVANGSASPAGATSSSSSPFKWSRKKLLHKAASPPPPPTNTNSPLLNPRETEQATMAVRVEEVVFRTVNDFGIYESLSGYGIVVTVKIRR